MFSERTSVGLDVHAPSVVAHGLDQVTGEVVRGTLVPGVESVTGWLSVLPGPVAVLHEAGHSLKESGAITNFLGRLFMRLVRICGR